MRGLLLGVCIATSAFAAGTRLYVPHAQARVQVNLGPPVYLGPSWQNPYVATPHRHYPSPYYAPLVYPAYVPVAYPVYGVEQPAPAPAPVVIEREVIREVPVAAEPAPAPQVVIVQVPAPPVPPVPPAPVEPPRPVGPRVPGPDVYSWTDDDGVVHYSTRVPADARGKAKKLFALER